MMRRFFSVTFPLLGLVLGSFQLAQADVPRPEYPRPQFERATWTNLNGIWTYAFAPDDSGKTNGMVNSTGFEGKILVPFCPESKLSGVEHTAYITNMWYQRPISIPADWADRRVLLHFGGVDYLCEVYLDGKFVDRHFGGSTSYSVDISAHVTPGAEHNLVLYVRDDLHSGDQQSGKQCKKPKSEGCFYTRTTGIWQTVWLEAVARNGLRECQIIPDLDQKRLVLMPAFYGIGPGQQLRVTVREGANVVATETVPASGTTLPVLQLKSARAWSPADPFLYDLLLEVLDGSGKVIDTVKSYAGLRKVHLQDGRIYLNNRPVYLRFVLDQGFYPDGIWTAPSDAALQNDIKLSMAAGFNGARLHQKVFEERFHYWADKLGYLTWGESPNWGLDHNRPAAARNFLDEWSATVRRDLNHPSIIAWNPLNECWWEDAVNYPRFNTDIYNLTRMLDPTRPVSTVSGGSFVVSDIYSFHNYEQDPAKLEKNLTFQPRLHARPKGVVNVIGKPYDGQPYIIGEYGGIKWNPATDKDGLGESWGYGDGPKTLEEFYTRLTALTAAVHTGTNVAGFCYTQLTDIEQEQNGIYRYDRSAKFDVQKIRAIFSKVPGSWSGE
jgi:beta-galactosidase/beta-glucuronidase